MHILSAFMRILAGGATLLPLLALAGEPEPAKVTFQLKNHVAFPEISEEETISINHVPVGAMRLGPDKAEEDLTITVPAAALYHYDLCGQAKLQLPDGTVRTMKIDHGGNLDSLDGRSLGVFSINHTIFFLHDMTIIGSKSHVRQEITKGHSCPQTVASAEPRRLDRLSF